MTREEAIARIRDHKIVHKMNEPRAIYISEALDMAIKALEAWDNLFKSYEVLTKEITESEDIKNATKRIDDWCIEQLRGIISDYYADLIIKENEYDT